MRLLVAIQTVVLLLSIGCYHERRVVVPLVGKIDMPIKTRHTYRVIREVEAEGWWMQCTDGKYRLSEYPSVAVDSVEGGFWMFQQWGKKKFVEDVTKSFAKYYPEVFSADGVPVRYEVRTRDWGDDVQELGLTGTLSMLTATVIPWWRNGENRIQIPVRPFGGEKSESHLGVYQRTDVVTSILPTPYLFLHGDPRPDDVKPHKSFVNHDYWCPSGDAGAFRHTDEAMAMGLAIRLHELEESGFVTDEAVRAAKNAYAAYLADGNRQVHRERKVVENVGRQNHDSGCLRDFQGKTQTPAAVPVAPRSAVEVPTYRVVSLERDSANNIRYKFVVELVGENIRDPLQGFRIVQRDFRKSVEEDYIRTYGPIDCAVRVDFSELKQVERRVEGVAIVLTIKPLSLSYDNQSRRGTVTVRFGVNQYEEARDWARRNIETLARDKNIALVTGQLPPEARYYSLGEKLKDGNVLEIEFKTE